VAGVTSDFEGADLPDPLNPGSFLTYDLYNTATVGTVTPDGTGGFDITFTLLFEVRITSGLLAGTTFETLTDALFSTTGASLPFAPGTVFGDPARPADGVFVFVKTDPSGILTAAGAPPGTLVGVSFDRTVTINAVVPEPTSLALLGAGAAGLLGWARRRK
jgi:hypothetical protein